jgi:ornithine cyclodeaminase/alanine dehydrogenase-like protein (mu-crystallin family)
VLFISDSEARSVVDLALAKRVVLEALSEVSAKRAATTKPPGIFIRTDEVPCVYQAKGAYMTGAAVAGFRLAGFPRGADRKGRLQMLVLADLATSVPYALIQGESLHPVRVGMAIAIAIERLRSTQAGTLALLGAGRLARGAIEAIQATTPFESVRVAARSIESARRFCESVNVADRKRLQPAADAESACHGADVIVTLTSVDEPLVRVHWCKPGSLLVSGGGRQECEAEAILGAHRIFIDDWAQCSLLGDIAALHRQGRIKESDLESLADVCVGAIPGRSSDKERLVAVPQGLAILDVALGHAVYRAALASGIGMRLNWD